MSAPKNKIGLTAEINTTDCHRPAILGVCIATGVCHWQKLVIGRTFGFLVWSMMNIGISEACQSKFCTTGVLCIGLSFQNPSFDVIIASYQYVQPEHSKLSMKRLKHREVGVSCDGAASV